MPVSRPNLIVCLGLTLLLGACGEKTTIESQRPRVVVQVAETNDYAAAATLTGDIQARVQTELSFRVGGKIISRSVDVGDRVTAKQVLARLDPQGPADRRRFGRCTGVCRAGTCHPGQ